MIVSLHVFLSFFLYTGTPHAKRAFFIACTSLFLSFCSGTLVIVSYVTDIFNRTGSSLSEKDSSILISITQIVANLVLLNIVERFNRRVSIFILCAIRHETFYSQYIYVSFPDTVHWSVAIDCDQLFYIQCLLFAMVQRAGIRMDATILFGLHHLFQLARPHSDSIHCHEWIISKKGEQTIDKTQLISFIDL